MSEEINLQLMINNRIRMSLVVDKEQISSRSTLFSGVFETCNFNRDEVVNLSLNTPENFSILLHYMETGIIKTELKTMETFASYINDIIYLGLTELENHALDMIENAFKEKNILHVDFSTSRPVQDFIERFIRERADKIQNCEFEMCQLFLNWAGDQNIQSAVLKELFQKSLQSENLKLKQIEKLQEDFPVAFDLLVTPSYLLKFWMLQRKTCSSCQQSVSKCSLGVDTCYGTYGYCVGCNGGWGQNTQRRGTHM